MAGEGIFGSGTFTGDCGPNQLIVTSTRSDSASGTVRNCRSHFLHIPAGIELPDKGSEPNGTRLTLTLFAKPVSGGGSWFL
jgi:hypothetical protein